MGFFQAVKNLSVVHNFRRLLAIVGMLSLVSGGSVHADPFSRDPNLSSTNTSDGTGGNTGTNIPDPVANGGGGSGISGGFSSPYNSDGCSAMTDITAQKKCYYNKATASQCPNKENEYTQAQKDFGKACAEAGLNGNSQCNDKVTLCGGDDSSDSSDSAASDAPNSAKCPMYSGQTYQERTDKANSDIQENQKQLADLKQNIADLSEKYNEQVIAAQEDVQKDSADLQARTLDRQKEVRDDNANAAAKSDAAKKSVTQIQSENLQLQSQVTQILTNKNTQMIAADVNSRKLKCTQQVYDSSTYKSGTQSGSATSFIYSSSYKSTMIQAIYANCMSQLQVQYDAISTTANSQIAAIQDKIKTNNDAIDQANNEAQIDASNAASDAAAVGTKDTQDQQQTNQKIQTAQQKLVLLQQTTQQKSQALQLQMNTLQQRSSQLQQQLVSLGQPPASLSGTKNISDVISASEEVQVACNNAKAACAGLDSDIAKNCGSKGKAKHTGSPSGGGGSGVKE